MPAIWIKPAEYDWITSQRKEVAVDGKPKKFESAATVVERIHKNYKEV
jgi:hypothetical protein